jgi:DNA-binding MarR family transcriptional regulator
MGEVDRDGSRTQRELSARLNISLGLVNTFMKRLVNKGYFKVKTLPRNRLKYFLTPKGLSQKSRLTLEYLKYSAHFYKEVKVLLLRKFEMLEEEGIERVLFWGTGEVAELAYLYLQQTGVQLAGIIDEQAIGQPFFGFSIAHFRRLEIPDWDRVLVTRLDDPARDIRLLVQHGVSRDRIVTL